MNNLQSAFGKDKKPQITELLARAEISPTIRAEALSIPEFARLADALLPLKEGE